MADRRSTPRRLFRCDCGWGEDVFELMVAEYQILPGKPLRMIGNNPERRVGDFATEEDAKAFLTETMGYLILEEV